jgi:DNA-binding HxlR family transcriptional regulator
MVIMTLKPLPNDPETARSALRASIAVLTGKWKLEILWLLNQRIHRFGELRQSIPGVTQHMLTSQLRELQANGLVTRKVFAEVPPKVEYAITNKARDLRPVFDAIFEWSKKYPGSNVRDITK